MNNDLIIKYFVNLTWERTVLSKLLSSEQLPISLRLSKTLVPWWQLLARKQNRNLLWLPQLLHIKYKPGTTDMRHFFFPDFCFEIKCCLGSLYRGENINTFHLIDLNYKQPRRGLKSWFNFDFAILDDNTFSDRDQFKWPVFVRFFLTSVSERLFIQTQILGFS